jgi:hypothetical protein
MHRTKTHSNGEMTMARKYEARPGLYAWNLEKCEEIILIAGYEEIAAYIPPGATWKAPFEDHLFQHGNGVSFDYLDKVNSERRRRGLEPINFKETDLYDYGRSNDRLQKSEHRRRVRAEIQTASIDVRQKMVDHARAEIEILPSPHQTFEEYKARQNDWKTEQRLSREETAKRTEIARQKAEEAFDIEKAGKMLTLTTDAELRAAIIEKLSGDNALIIAGQIDDQQLRDVLVKHCLARL